MKDYCQKCYWYESLCAGAGRCRRHAPTIQETRLNGLCSWIGERPPDRDLVSMWPKVKAFGWCGDFEDREGKE
jgi:hypothetical protein